jgi:hypothetical protein
MRIFGVFEKLEAILGVNLRQRKPRRPNGKEGIGNKQFPLVGNVEPVVTVEARIKQGGRVGRPPFGLFMEASILARSLLDSVPIPLPKIFYLGMSLGGGILGQPSGHRVIT